MMPQGNTVVLAKGETEEGAGTQPREEGELEQRPTMPKENQWHTFRGCAPDMAGGYVGVSRDRVRFLIGTPLSTVL